MTRSLVINGLLASCGVSFCYVLGCLCHSLFNPIVRGNDSTATSGSPSATEQYACAEEDFVRFLEGFGIKFEAGASVANRLVAIEDQGLATAFPLETFSSPGEFFGLLEYPSKVYAVVGGYYHADDGVSYFQLVNLGSGAADLVPRQILVRDGATSVWVMKTQPKVTANSGSISISFNKPWVNLGVDDGTKESRAAFVREESNDQLVMPCQVTLANEGEEPVFVEKIVSSCGCLAVSGKSRIPIPAGASHVFHLKANLGEQAKYAHSLLFIFGNDKNEKLSRKYEVFGNRVLGHQSISLTSVYLGELSSDRSKQFTFSMHESIDDRFDVLGTNAVGDHFFDVSVKPRTMPNGLYRHDFTITPHTSGTLVEAYGQETRPLRGVLKIKTTSPKQSSVSLEVYARLVANTTQPAVMALGQVQKNAIHRIAVPGSWVSDDHSLIDVRTSGGSQVGVDAGVADDTEASPAITVRFRVSGVVEQPMTCLLKSDSGASKSIDFVLSAFVMPKGD